MEGLRSLVLVDLDWTDILQGFSVVVVLGVVMVALNVRLINRYD
jgi:ABC-2 type transport system permease protein